MEATIKTYGGGITSYKFSADGTLSCNGNLRIRSSTDDSIIYGLTGVKANYPECPSSATLVLRRIGAGPFITMELLNDVSDANSEIQTIIGSFRYGDVENPSSNEADISTALATGVEEPQTKSSDDFTAESSAQRLARIARAANLPIASLPNLRDLQSEDYSVLESLLDGIKDETGLDGIAKSILASAAAQAANMAYSPVLKTLVFDRFGLQSQMILKGFKANPMEYYGEASDSIGVDLAKGIAIGIAGSMVADAVFSLKPLSDLPPNWKEPMRAMTKATVVETINLGTSAVDPSVAAAGIANRLYEFYLIYKASVALADTQNEAIVAAAISLETAARLVTLNPSEKNNEIARSTISSTVANLNEAFGDGYSVAMTELVNLTFVGLLSEFRGDSDRATQMVVHIREKGKLGADDVFPDVVAHPINWMASFVTWGGDPPSRVAALMISSTVLNSIGQGGQAAPDIVDQAQPPVAVEAVPQPETPMNGDIWGPDIVPPNGFDVGSVNWGVDCTKADAKKCLTDRGLTSAAVDFNLAAFPDAPDGGIASEFRELGVVDWVNLSVIYSPYEATLLVNGKPDIIDPEPTRDIAAAFSDSTSLSMLRRFPQATAIGGRIASYRALPSGQQRFVFVETVFDGCHACDVLGAAVTFLDFDSNGTLTLRHPIGLNLGEAGQDEELTTDVLLKDPLTLQTALNVLGYDAGPMDGFPGPQSRQALMEFQAEHCLTITGQPDQSTLSALLGTNGFSVPCPGAIFPEGVSANSPLLAGMYVDDLSKCQLEELPLEGSHLSQRIVRSDGGVTFGYEGGCTVDRSDIRDGVTLFRGTCSEGNSSYAGSWTFDVQSNESFVDVDMNGERPPRRFAKCADDSPLRRTWAAWFEETATTVQAPEVAVPATEFTGRVTTEALLSDGPDLINIYEYLQADGPCGDEPCNFSGVEHDYIAYPATGEIVDYALAKQVFSMIVERGGSGAMGTGPEQVSKEHPISEKIRKSIASMLAYRVERADCSMEKCPWAFVAAFGYGPAVADETFSFGDGFFIDMAPAGSTTTEIGYSGFSPIADGTYINMSAFGGAPGLCAESTIKDEEALRVTEGKLGFYEYACEIVGSRPSSKDGYVTLALRCDGEGEQWEVEQHFQRTSEATFELGGEHYQGCLGREWVAADAVTDPEADLQTFCQSNPNDSGPGEDGTDNPAVLAAGANTWRCMDGEVLVCDLGASGRACLPTSQPSDQRLKELDDFCLQNANSDYIAGYLIGGLADEWLCDGTKAVAVKKIPVDRLGYFVEAWRRLEATKGTANTATPNTAFHEPQKGSQERTAILDAVRPLVERELGGPIEFVVGWLRVADGRAYVDLQAQRPGGGVIEPETTPRFQEGRWDGLGGDERIVSGFLRFSDGAWQPYDIIFGASEAWWVEDCSGLENLMPETCGSGNAVRAVTATDPDPAPDYYSTTVSPPTPSGGPSNDEIARALVGNTIVRQHIARFSVNVIDCVPQEEINRPGFRGPFWACSFSVTEAVFKNPAATGWDEWAMLTGSAETRFIQGIRTGVTEWTQRFGQAKNGSWGVQFIFR